MNSETHFTYSNVYVPLPIKLLNKITSSSMSTSARFNRLDARNLLKTARHKTGLSDWGDSRVKEALAALVESVIQEGNLTLFGRFTMRKFLLENLSSRLRITEAKSFAWWLLDHGMQQGYEFYKAQLQLLSWLRPAKRWIVKWPYHLWHIDTLRFVSIWTFC